MINFFKEDVRFRISNAEPLKRWLDKVFKASDKKAANVNYVFCSDQYLKKMNKKYLEHNYFTDIITFDNTNIPALVEGDIFISVDRVKANAKTFKTTFKDELHRVMVHGALHLTGWNDKTEKEQQQMRQQEDAWLGKRTF